MADGRSCLNCKSPLGSPVHGMTKFCSIRCRLDYHPQKASLGPSVQKTRRINSGVAGAIGELLVSADLLTKGFEVYRAVSQSASCDPLALKQGETYRVEVRTKRKDLKGGLSCTGRMSASIDILAMVVHDSHPEIYYWPTSSRGKLLNLPCEAEVRGSPSYWKDGKLCLFGGESEGVIH